MISSTEEPKYFVKVLLDETGEAVAVEKDGIFYLPCDDPTIKLPPQVNKEWDFKTMTVWHNAPCCIKSGSTLICWPPCV